MIDPKTGVIRVEAWPVALKGGLLESEIAVLVANGQLEKVKGVVPPDAVYGSQPIRIAGRDITLSVGFRAGTLDSVSLTLVGTEFWVMKTHEENVAWLKQVFPQARAVSKVRTVAKLEKGEATAYFLTNTGALGDGGASMNIRYTEG